MINKSVEVKVEVAKAEDSKRGGSADGEAIITLKNVTKKFGDNVVLDNLSLTIEKGKTTVVIGPSGCGKTILIKHFNVLLRPSEGEVYFKKKRIDNLEENQLNRIRTHYGFLFQEGALFDSFSV
ncbi:MAG: ATP-binding cassette domain-containing protein, partial [Planctomycetota bacterium]